MFELKMTGYNTHDCHMMLSWILDIIIWVVNQPYVEMVITQMCHIFYEMEHYMIHIADQIFVLGHVYLYHMYPYKRYMSIMKEGLCTQSSLHEKQTTEMRPHEKQRCTDCASLSSCLAL
jgi:hypothetical protein